MLCWEVFISTQASPARGAVVATEPALAIWLAGLGGTKWVDDLVAKGIAQDLGGDGYPDRFLVPAGVLLDVLACGPPKHPGPLATGDDYVLPSGSLGEARIDVARLRSLDPDSLLLVEAWDQS